MNIEKYAFQLFILACILFTIFALLLVTQSASAQNLPPVSVYTPPESSKDLWIDNLASCESGGRIDISVMDSNNRYSYGLLQFQLATFMGYGKQYGILPESLSNEDGLLLIHNPFIQRGIAHKMLDDGLSYHWLNCSKKIGYAYPITGT